MLFLFIAGLLERISQINTVSESRETETNRGSIVAVVFKLLIADLTKKIVLVFKPFYSVFVKF